MLLCTVSDLRDVRHRDPGSVGLPVAGPRVQGHVPCGIQHLQYHILGGASDARVSAVVIRSYYSCRRKFPDILLRCPMLHIVGRILK